MEVLFGFRLRKSGGKGLGWVRSGGNRERRSTQKVDGGNEDVSARRLVLPPEIFTIYEMGFDRLSKDGPTLIIGL